MAAPKKQSLFAQRMQNAKKLKTEERNEVSDAPILQQNNVDIKVFGESSNIIDGPEAKDIHLENINKLAAMHPREIEEERNKLLASLDPSIVEFLKARKCTQSKRKTTEVSEASTSYSKNSSESEVPAPAAQLVNKFPHMNVVEPEKLQWMQDPSLPQQPPPGCPYNARFNFEGDLLPYCENKMTEGLYHHGEEPQRPGYTLQELIQLSRSSVLQQRTTALSTLANIFHKASDYDRCLDQPLLPQLLDSELYLLLRFSLDDPVRAVVSAAVAALASLLSSTKDEGCLDRLLGLTAGLRQPSFYVHLGIKPSELAELKDTELLKVDVIRGTLRTHLLPRFRYILEKLNPEPVEAGHILRCLVRIARHSPDAATTISNTPGLLSTVRNLLRVPPPMASSEALKVFRVIACQSRTLASHLVDTYNLMEPIQHFIAGNRDETTMSLVLESFYTWQTFLTYHLTTNHVSCFSPVVQRLLVWHVEAVGLDGSGGDLEHGAALVSWLGCVLRVNSTGGVRGCLPPLRLCALKWLSQASQVSFVQWAACKLLEAVLCTVSVLIKLEDFKCNDIQRKVEMFLCSDNFNHLSNKMRQCSWLLRGEQNPRVVESLPCLGSVPPSLYDSSPLPLIVGLAVYIYTVKSPQLSEKFVSSHAIQSYTEEVVTAGARTTTAHWFARQEIVLLYTLLQIHLNTRAVENSLVHQAALFLSTSIHADDRYLLTDLFNQVIFNKHFFRPDIAEVIDQLQSLRLNSELESCETDISRRAKLLNEALDSLSTICKCYMKEFGLVGLEPVNPPVTLTASHLGTEPALPADWHCLPIVHLNNIDGQQENAVEVALSCLQWSLVLESLRPQFVTSLSVASRFCRLACVLLAGNELFRDVREWLKEVLQVILAHNDQMDFNKPIPGLQSFYDFYRQILEQFVGVSYGDPVFGQFVLIPLQQQHDIRFRKLVWCELGAVLRFLSTPVDQIGVPLENFLEPCETDPDILFIYLKALGQGRIRETFCPVLHKVAVHHVATYVIRYPDLPTAKRLTQLIGSLGNQVLKDLLMNYCTTSHVNETNQL